MNENDDRYDFYSLQYARFSGDLAAEIRREVYGSDIGQQGWRTLEEQDDITALVGEPRLANSAKQSSKTSPK